MATSRRLRLTATTLVLVIAAAAGTVAAVVTTGHRHPAVADPGIPAAADAAPAAPGVVDVSLNDCGSAWSPGPAGAQEIAVHNADFHPGEVRVVGVDAHNQRQVFAQIEPLGPDTTVTTYVRLAAGQYALQCLFEEQPPLTGPAHTIAGDAPGVRGVVPIPQDQLIRATLRYTDWVRRQLPLLEQQTRSLAHAVAAGNLADGKRLWLLAHAGYERLGAAYDAFGDLDGVINGLPSGLARGVRDPEFTGFHRVELALWDPGSTSAAERRHQADELADAVDDLRDELSGAQLDPLTFSIRAHEIAENLLRPVLTGRADFGSHSDLATVAAGLDGDVEVLTLVRKPLRSRYPHVRGLFRELDRARHLVARLARGRLGRTAIADWPIGQRQRVDAVVAGLAERLAPVASVLEPRRVT
jgi:iron uptake system component EfeO